MKEKQKPTEIISPDNYEYHCLKGLSAEGKKWAKVEIQKQKDKGDFLFMG